ncbi:hypothetical protein BD779DRAFT_1668615 [Infundibulicybe gibba]|nr:hypothetical protein BD779DRAFT_1668615 [Infundibulicybe gibba]
MPVVEVLTFPASEDFISDRSALLKPVLDRLIQVEGCLSIYHGLQFEDGKTAYLAVVWETYEHHLKLIETKGSDALLGTLKPLLAGAPEFQHAEMENPYGALSAPVNEFAYITVKEGQSKEDLIATLDTFHQELGKIGIPQAFGESREKPGTFVVLVGWKNKEAHGELASQEEMLKIFGALGTLSTVELGHADLVKHTV